MIHQQYSPQTAELDARNRAASYVRDAQQQVEQNEQAISKQQASDFQQMLWLKNLDQSQARELQTLAHMHTMALRSADHEAALELEAAKHQATLELRRLELEHAVGLQGVRLADQVPETPFWQSKLFQTVLVVSLPFIIRAILQAVRPHHAWSHRLRDRRRGHARSSAQLRAKPYRSGRASRSLGTRFVRAWSGQ